MTQRTGGCNRRKQSAHVFPIDFREVGRVRPYASVHVHVHVHVHVYVHTSAVGIAGLAVANAAARRAGGSNRRLVTRTSSAARGRWRRSWQQLARRVVSKGVHDGSDKDLRATGVNKA